VGRTKRFLGNLYQVGEIEKLLKLYHLRGQLSQLIIANKGAIRDKNGVSYSTSQEVFELFGEILSQAQQSVNSWHGTLMFVYLPHWSRYSNEGAVNSDRERVLTLVKNLNLPIIDLHPAFAAHEDPLRFFPLRQLGHYNVEGNRLVAEEVLQALAK
jgi:hypothetical protein